MIFKLPDLPYAHDALSPAISAETLSYHHGKHHAGYVKKLNLLLSETPDKYATLEQIIRAATPGGDLFNLAAQSWNHGFYWSCMSPERRPPAAGKLLGAIQGDFGGFDQFTARFMSAGGKLFGSGWCWLVADPKGKLEIRATSDADTPLRTGETPLFVADVWEHAYYIDYRNRRADYLKAFWSVANWRFAEENFVRAAHAHAA